MVSFDGKNYPIQSFPEGIPSDVRLGRLVTDSGKHYLICTRPPATATTDKVNQLWGYTPTGYRPASAQGESQAFVVEVSATRLSLIQGKLPQLTDSSDPGFIWAMPFWFSEPDTADISNLHGGQLLDYVLQSQQQIAQDKLQGLSIIQTEKYDPDMSAIHQEVHQLKDLVPCESGAGGAYFMKDAEGHVRYVIKAGDEDVFNLNNRKQMASPFPVTDSRFRYRASIPNHRGVYNEAMGYQVAKIIGCSAITPKTALAVIEHEGFHVVSDLFEGEISASLHAKGDKEKLCSVQEFIPGGKSLAEVLVEVEQSGEPLEIHQQDLEDVNFLIWVLGDQDAHEGNFIVYREPGHKEFRLKKIDNGATLGFSEPGMESPLRNILGVSSKMGFQQMSRPLSSAGREKILQISTQAITEKMTQYHYAKESIQSLVGRVAALQGFVQRHPEATLEEINQHITEHYSGD